MIHHPAGTKALVVQITAVVVCMLLYVGGCGSFAAAIGVGIVLLVALAIILDLR